ncbi:MAG: SpoIIE family protein phosphatase, partial [Candidatus Riflebacteria bacterium]
EKGDTLILYTDGIIEAAGPNGEMFDYGRFVELIKSSCNFDLETFWGGIIEGNRRWARQQDDDLTFMLIRYD